MATQQQLVKAVKDVINQPLGRNNQRLVPPQLDEATAERIKFIERQQEMGWRGLAALDLGLPVDAPHSEVQKAMTERLGRRAVTRDFRPYMEQVDDLGRERVSIVNRFEKSPAVLNRVADAVLSGDTEGLQAEELLMAAGTPQGLRSGIFTTDVLQREVNRIEQQAIDALPRQGGEVRPGTGEVSTGQQFDPNRFVPGGPPAEDAPGNAGGGLGSDVLPQPRFEPPPELPRMGGEVRPGTGEVSTGQPSETDGGQPSNLPIGAPLKMGDQWVVWNGSNWVPADPGDVQRWEAAGVTGTRFHADGSIEFLGSDGNTLQVVDPQGNISDTLPDGTAPGAGDGTADGGFDFGDFFAPPTGVLGQKPPWWDDQVFGDFTRFTPSQVDQVFQQALAGAWGEPAQQLASQFAQQTTQGETFQDPNTGAWFVRQPNGNISPLPESLQPGQQEQAPSIDQQIAQAIADDDLDRAQALLDFVRQPSDQDRLNAALEFARSPADVFTLSNAAAGNLPLPQAGEGARAPQGPGGDPEEALRQVMQEQGFRPEQIDVAVGQFAARMRNFGESPEQAFGTVFPFDNELQERFNQLTAVPTGQAISRIGPQADFVQQAAQGFFGEPDLSALMRQAAPGQDTGFQGAASGQLPQQGGEVRPGTGEVSEPGQQTGAPLAATQQMAAALGVPPTRLQGLPPETLDFLNRFVQRGQGRAAVMELINQGVLQPNFLEPASFAEAAPGVAQETAAGFGAPAQTAAQGDMFGGLAFPTRVAQTLRGESLGQPANLLSAAGIRPPSAQAIRNMLPGERDVLAETGRLAGIPDPELQQAFRQTTPGGFQAASPRAAFQSARPRRFSV